MSVNAFIFAKENDVEAKNYFFGIDIFTETSLPKLFAIDPSNKPVFRCLKIDPKETANDKIYLDELTITLRYSIEDSLYSIINDGNLKLPGTRHDVNTLLGRFTALYLVDLYVSVDTRRIVFSMISTQEITEHLPYIFSTALVKHSDTVRTSFLNTLLDHPSCLGAENGEVYDTECFFEFPADYADKIDNSMIKWLDKLEKSHPKLYASIFPCGNPHV
jgi:hypothetical protein